ncbi:uncharacterized protein LOC5512855 isoform X2 [Nematostella vectensis]|uniref:uncharacterized protein LOC5512855 isoform X2 n=1 Tax=Nematostella vectensis TaxID=45351 RepID=UPI002076EE40|nr:uncharacterized protein LOC5512855 isoform X2 [Nematostella vectensis]
MRQLAAIALWVVLAMVHGREIIRGESDDLESRLKDLTEDALMDQDTCPARNHKVNCYVDDANNKALPEILFQDRSEHSPKYGGELIDWHNWDFYIKRLVCRCAQSAKAKGYHYFAIQYYGVCYSSPTTTNPHSLSQVTNFCTTYNYQECEPTSELPCVGRNLTNFVYHLEEGGSGGGDVGYHPAYDL